MSRTDDAARTARERDMLADELRRKDAVLGGNHSDLLGWDYLTDLVRDRWRAMADVAINYVWNG